MNVYEVRPVWKKNRQTTPLLFNDLNEAKRVAKQHKAVGIPVRIVGPEPAHLLLKAVRRVP